MSARELALSLGAPAASGGAGATHTGGLESGALLRATRRVLRGAWATSEGLARAQLIGDPGALSWLAENLCAIHGVQIVVEGELPRGPLVLVANHVSYLDPLVLLTQIAAAPIAKRELADWPLLGSAAERLGVLYVDRQSAASGARVLRAARRILERGGAVLGFPEGTTSQGRAVRPFRRGLFGLARIAGVPVVPAAIRYTPDSAAWTGEAAFAPHYLRTAARRRTLAEVRFGAPLRFPGADLGATPALFAEVIRTRIEAMLEKR
jgi:1-acyl-sn-glycerol-3-phosphate acyltransferase